MKKLSAAEKERRKLSTRAAAAVDEKIRNGTAFPPAEVSPACGCSARPFAHIRAGGIGCPYIGFNPAHYAQTRRQF
jgi:hypothetical protein